MSFLLDAFGLCCAYSTHYPSFPTHSLALDVTITMTTLFEKYIKKAREERDRGELERALRTVQSAVHLSPHDDDACVLQIRVLQELGRYEMAVRYLDSRIEKRPYHPWSLLEASDLLINRLRRPADGLHRLSRLFRGGGMTRSQELRACRLQAEALIDLDRCYDAWLFLQRARKRYAEDTHLLFLAGWSAVRQEMFDEAVPLLTYLTHQEPDHADAHFYLGVAHESRGDKEATHAAFSLVYKLDTQHPPQRRYRFDDFRLLVEQLARTHLSDILGYLRVVVEPYPDEQVLQTFPYDPRRVSILSEFRSFLPSIGPVPQKRLTVYHWNLERLCFSDEEILLEVKQILQEEAFYIRLEKAKQIEALQKSAPTLLEADDAFVG